VDDLPPQVQCALAGFESELLSHNAVERPLRLS
jgi:hypothetical protein